MNRSETLKAALLKAFSPEHLEIINESHLHAGHHHTDRGHEEEFDGSGETHLRVRIVTHAFAGMSRLERHRAINALAAPVIADGLHALAVDARTPAEAGA
jgi:BolA protein